VLLFKVQSSLLQIICDSLLVYSHKDDLSTAHKNEPLKLDKNVVLTLEKFSKKIEMSEALRNMRALSRFGIAILAKRI